MKTALVIGGGPAGLMAADRLAARGIHVDLMEGNPSVGRKFLMAGKSGLNLTMDLPMEDYLKGFSPYSPVLEPIFESFGPQKVIEWAQSLGQEVFTGSSGRVFPVAMKASPLLRAWMAHLTQAGVQVHTRHRWVAVSGQGYGFDTPQGPITHKADVVVLACGGASWARLGSDGGFTLIMPSLPMTPFKPANMGFTMAWSAHMAKHFGQPVKGVSLQAGEVRSRGEFIISERGLEGGGIYAVSAAMRDGADLVLDLAPDLTEAQVTARLAQTKAKQSLSNRLRKALKLEPVKIALLQEFARPLPPVDQLAPLIKALAIPHTGPRPMDEAISVAGGLSMAALNQGLMIDGMPGVFAAGEMLDWEAPTGGYLISGCLATGRWAGDYAAKWLGAG